MGASASFHLFSSGQASHESMATNESMRNRALGHDISTYRSTREGGCIPSGYRESSRGETRPLLHAVSHMLSADLVDARPARARWAECTLASRRPHDSPSGVRDRPGGARGCIGYGIVTMAAPTGGRETAGRGNNTRNARATGPKWLDV